MERYNELKALLESFEPDFEKFYVKGNKSAGVRVRKAMNELKKKAQEIRIEVQNMKSAEAKG
ncbi:MAG TPA: histone H1 [Candidatus Kapabacteria bacterium]|nr:histone H1 [Candidatus Kapabacteria bacterium]